MRLRSVLVLSLLTLGLSLAFALVGNVATGTVEPPESWWWWWTPAVWTVTGLLAAASLWVAYLLLAGPPATPGTDVVADLAARLDDQVR